CQNPGIGYGKPFTFGPEKYALSELAFEVYNELDIVDPKFHFRVSENTPPDLLKQVSNLICNGRTAVVMVNNDMQKSMLQANGKTPEDADDYILIGCYEPAVMGVELNCSGAGTLNLAKAVEQVILSAPEHWQYEDVKQAYFIQLQKNLEQCIADLKRFERLWSSSNPAPLFSGPMQSCHERGKDISEAGAKYNTTGICCVGLPDAVDSLIAVGELFKRKLITSISELKNILLDNWQKHELLRQIVLHKFPSWGNDNAEVDALAVEIADAVGSWINKTDNTRNGKFQAALYAILPTAQLMGKYTGALPNGRLANTVLTMNTNCENGRDLNGVTAILRSAAKLPLHWFVNGTTLDITLHPSVVSAGKGSETVCSLIRSYFQLGGTTLQFNVFNRKMLLEAQQNPAAYANLQIRVCGWNVRFIDLAPEEQQIFIDRANGGNSC
ncbi:MAG: hypothetical protein E7052_04805, partial [Lentisphaerae bacterium]|nr:hypothetical protein [Lentisphaerota bacterium]